LRRRQYHVDHGVDLLAELRAGERVNQIWHDNKLWEHCQLHGAAIDEQ
jgi:hypothetical protein